MHEYYTFLGHKVRSLNIEITNRCYLGCSECTRTMLPHTVQRPLDLSLDVLKAFFPLKDKAYISQIKMNICGALGDAAYHPHAFEIVEYFRTLGCPIYLETNGSYKDVSFWRELSKLLGKENWLNFSVDGLSDTNHLYRKRARWNDIVEGIKESVQWTNVRWKWIVFSTNEHQIEAGREFARELGVHHFLLVKSDRFRGENDKLLPQEQKWNSVVSQNKIHIKKLINKRDEDLNSVDIKPRCYSGKGLSISSSGLFHPCQGYYAATLWRHDKNEVAGVNIENATLGEALSDPRWEKMRHTWGCPSDAAEVCIMKCGVHQKFQQEYANFTSGKDLLDAKPYVDELVELNRPHYLLGDH